MAYLYNREIKTKTVGNREIQYRYVGAPHTGGDRVDAYLILVDTDSESEVVEIAKAIGVINGQAPESEYDMEDPAAYYRGYYYLRRTAEGWKVTVYMPEC